MIHKTEKGKPICGRASGADYFMEDETAFLVRSDSCPACSAVLSKVVHLENNGTAYCGSGDIALHVSPSDFASRHNACQKCLDRVTVHKKQDGKTVCGLAHVRHFTYGDLEEAAKGWNLPACKKCLGLKAVIVHFKKDGTVVCGNSDPSPTFTASTQCFAKTRNSCSQCLDYISLHKMLTPSSFVCGAKVGTGTNGDVKHTANEWERLPCKKCLELEATQAKPVYHYRHEKCSGCLCGADRGTYFDQKQDLVIEAKLQNAVACKKCLDLKASIPTHFIVRNNSLCGQVGPVYTTDGHNPAKDYIRDVTPCVECLARLYVARMRYWEKGGNKDLASCVEDTKHWLKAATPVETCPVLPKDTPIEPHSTLQAEAKKWTQPSDTVPAWIHQAEDFHIPKLRAINDSTHADFDGRTFCGLPTNTVNALPYARRKRLARITNYCRICYAEVHATKSVAMRLAVTALVAGYASLATLVFYGL